MAKIREPEKNVKDESESSEYEEGSGNSSEEIESDPEIDTNNTKKPSSPPPKKSQLPQPSSSEEESGSESEPDSDQNAPKKPLDDPQKSSTGARKPQPKNTGTEPVTPAKRPAKEKQVGAKDAKRPKMKPEPVSQKKETAVKDAKKPNKNSESVSELNSGVSADSSKKVLFQRLYSEDDEIVILKGMLEYEAKTKSSPLVDITAFLDYIKKNLHVDVNKTQLQHKIKRLKKKYVNNKTKGRNLSKLHEQVSYELSEKIWGNEKGKEIATPSNKGESYELSEKIWGDEKKKEIGTPSTKGVSYGLSEKILGNEKGKEIATPSTKGNGSEVQKTPTKKANVVQNGEHEGAMSVGAAIGAPQTPFVANRVSSYGLTTEEMILRIGAELFEGNEEVEGAKEWKELAQEDMELSLKKLDVKRAQMSLVLDKLK